MACLTGNEVSVKSETESKKGFPNAGDIPVEEIVNALKQIRHGYVQIVVQDGRVIQIETHEKKRLERS